jgi:hypothetical protein
MTETAYHFWLFYQREVADFWNTLGPREYSTILIIVGVVGWLAMRTNLKR